MLPGSDLSWIWSYFVVFLVYLGRQLLCSKCRQILPTIHGSSIYRWSYWRVVWVHTSAFGGNHWTTWKKTPTQIRGKLRRNHIRRHLSGRLAFAQEFFILFQLQLKPERLFQVRWAGNNVKQLPFNLLFCGRNHLKCLNLFGILIMIRYGNLHMTG